jgi:hypothetical protein
LALAFGLSLALCAPGALAQERDVAAAQAMFDQARELAQQGKYAEACPKFQESNRLDPGIGTQFHLADCYEHSGRLASAWALFVDVAAQARVSGQLDREKVLLERAQQLQPRLPKLQVNVPEGSKTAGLEIRRNGILVGSAQWGTPMPIDPGDVELSIAAPGKQTLRQTIHLEESKILSYSVPALVDAAPSTPPPTTPAAEPSAAGRHAPPAAPQPVTETSTVNGNRPWIIGLGVVGVVGLGVGTTFALLAKSKFEDSKKECDNDDVNLCSSRGVQLRNSALTRGNVATVGFAAGAGALIGAGIAWLAGSNVSTQSARSAVRWTTAPVVGPTSAALFLQGDY